MKLQRSILLAAAASTAHAAVVTYTTTFTVFTSTLWVTETVYLLPPPETFTLSVPSLAASATQSETQTAQSSAEAASSASPTTAQSTLQQQSSLAPGSLSATAQAGSTLTTSTQSPTSQTPTSSPTSTTQSPALTPQTPTTSSTPTTTSTTVPTTSSTSTKQSPTSSPSPSPTALTQFESDILDEHNVKRALHGVGALSWNATLTEFAKNYANSKFSCDNVQLIHLGGPFGENLAAGYVGGRSPVDAWYDEISKYDYSNPGYSGPTGHFTQLIWKDTTQVGCYEVKCNNEWRQYTICEYSPRGNIVGQTQDVTQRIFRAEVLPLVSQ